MAKLHYKNVITIKCSINLVVITDRFSGQVNTVLIWDLFDVTSGNLESCSIVLFLLKQSESWNFVVNTFCSISILASFDWLLNNLLLPDYPALTEKGLNIFNYYGGENGKMKS